MINQKYFTRVHNILLPQTAAKKESTEHSDETQTSDTVFFGVLSFSALCIVILLVSIFITLTVDSLPSLKAFGTSFFFEKTWDPVFGVFGALPFLVGTLLTSFLSLLISLPFSLSISIFLGEYFKKGTVSSILKSAIELLAGIPSIIYGFWGLFVLVPIIRFIEIQLGVAPCGVGIATASVILAIMIIPYSASLGAEVVQLVPSDLKEAAFSLGATFF